MCSTCGAGAAVTGHLRAGNVTGAAPMGASTTEGGRMSDSTIFEWRFWRFRVLWWRYFGLGRWPYFVRNFYGLDGQRTYDVLTWGRLWIDYTPPD